MVLSSDNKIRKTPYPAMNRKPRPAVNKSSSPDLLSGWRQQLVSRRQLLLAAAGGSLAVMFPPVSAAASNNRQMSDPWSVIDAVQQHLFPAEAGIPGAREINALVYLQFVITDTTLDADDREFISKGVGWLEDIAVQMYKKSFVTLDEKQREKVLQRIAASEAGENWLSTLLLYIVEALLTDPVYGGNTDQLGWKWLQHVPGFPRPPADKTFVHLLS
jgi:gluconate 2-dehydrogenase gamma chain